MLNSKLRTKKFFLKYPLKNRYQTTILLPVIRKSLTGKNKKKTKEELFETKKK
jgi:hypothetical protein